MFKPTGWNSQSKKTGFFRLLIIIVLGVCFFPGTLSAQDAGWELLLYSDSPEIIAITPEGVETQVELPAELADFRSIYQPTISADGQYLAFVGTTLQDDDSLAMGIYIANLEMGECCQQLSDPISSGMDFAQLGSFSPDGSQIAASIANLLEGAAAGQPASLIAVFNTTSGEVVYTLPPAILGNDLDPSTTAYLGEWSADGLLVAPTCAECESRIKGKFHLWDPFTNTLTATETPYRQTAAVLPLTGEAVAPEIDPEFPSTSEFVSNVVAYYANASQDTRTVIAFDPDNPQIRSANWVLDGQAVLVTYLQNPEGVLIYRDGTQQTLEVGSDSFFLAGTPDGWVMVDLTNVLYYRIIDGEVDVQQLGTIEGQLIMIQHPQLGATASGEFPVVEP